MAVPKLNKSQLKTYTKLWKKPKVKDLRFSEVGEADASVRAKQSQSSANVLFEIGDERWGMHHPHPDRGLKMPYIKQMRKFLNDCGLEPGESTDDGNC